MYTSTALELHTFYVDLLDVCVTQQGGMVYGAWNLKEKDLGLHPGCATS